jgi:hypothetical protein
MSKIWSTRLPNTILGRPNKSTININEIDSPIRVEGNSELLLLSRNLGFYGTLQYLIS